MEKRKGIFTGGIRLKIFSILLVTIVLIITAYTAVFFFQTNRVEQLVNDTYEAQEQFYIENGLQYQYRAVRNNALEAFHREMKPDGRLLFGAWYIPALYVWFCLSMRKEPPGRSFGQADVWAATPGPSPHVGTCP